VSGGPQDVLIIGYGNPLRSDDGVGWQAAELLTDDPRLADAQILACHQLTPELAEDVSRAGFVVLIDASTEPGVPGSVETRELSGAPSDEAESAFSHHIDASRLLGLAEVLYGQCPPAVQVSIRVTDLDAGTGLSSSVLDGMPMLLDTVIDVIQRHGQSRA
jgi:hydrogenase maturation protease